MSTSEGKFVMSRSRTPSLIRVTSLCDNENVIARESSFAELPDIIQEAALSTEFFNSDIKISRANEPLTDAEASNLSHVTQPVFFISTRTNSGISMPNLHLTDQKLLSKYGSDLTANFAEIKMHGAKAFFSKRNDSTKDNYAICACATGYIWIRILLRYKPQFPRQWSDIEVQIGTFALQTRAITTASIPCRYKIKKENDVDDGKVAMLCATVMAKYLSLRMLGSQYEDATEVAMNEAREEMAYSEVVDPKNFGDLRSLLLQICANAPLPPTSDVSLISRGMIRRRWNPWTDSVPKVRFQWATKFSRFWVGRKEDAVGMLSRR